MEGKLMTFEEFERMSYSFKKQLSKQKLRYEAILKEKEEAIRNLLQQVQGPGIEHRLDGSVVYNPNSVTEVKYGDVSNFMKMKYDLGFFARYILKEVYDLELRQYQKCWLDLFVNNHNCAINAFRQSGKSLISDIYAIWYIIFNSSKIVAMGAIKNDLCKEHKKELTKILEFLERKRYISIIRNNKNVIELENGSQIRFVSGENLNTARGFGINLFIFDDYAFWKCGEEVLKTIFPTMNSANPKDHQMIFISTPFGLNHFHKVYTNPEVTSITTTIDGSFEYWYNKVQQLIIDIGLMAVRQEYYCEFIGPDDKGIKIQLGNHDFFYK